MTVASQSTGLRLLVVKGEGQLGPGLYGSLKIEIG